MESRARLVARWCAHCGTRIRFPETMVLRDGRSFCCANCADAEDEATLQEQLELELGERPVNGGQ